MLCHNRYLSPLKFANISLTWAGTCLKLTLGWPHWCLTPFIRGYEDEIASEGRDHLKGNRIELSEEGTEALSQKISQLQKGQEITIKYFTDGYYEDIAGVLDAVDAINKELRIYTGFINDTGKELPTIIAFEDISEIGVNMTWITIFAMPAATASLLSSSLIVALIAER